VTPRSCPGPDRHPRRPRYVPPPRATDTHAHIFGPPDVYPYGDKRSYTPEACTADDYDALLATLGFERAALVQGGAHGTDNRAILAAIARHPDRFRGVAVIPPGRSGAELAALHDGGIRGVRLSTVVGGGVTFDQLERLADEVHELGWHVVLHFHHADELLDVVPILERIRNPFVLDHLARITPADGGTASAPFAALLRLLDTGRCYPKLASLYRLSSEPYPHDDVLPMIHAVAERAPDRIIWGSNWPHPILYDRAMPNDGDIADLIPLWVPDPAVQEQMLVHNPARLYGFDDVA
jgi:predicted TIM-barrel fold metal-dependent hydrolase